MKHEDCGHDVEYMGVAVYGGEQAVPMRCLECLRERAAKGACSDCGEAEAPFALVATFQAGDQTGEESYGDFCRRCWKRMHAPEKCEACGRYVPASTEYAVVGETPEHYDPWWGPQPAEPIYEMRCDRCKKEKR